MRFGNKEIRKTKFSETKRGQRSKNYSVSGDVEEARSAAAAVEIGAAEEVLLSMACNLRWRASLHEVSRYSSPVSFPYLLQSEQEQLVLLLRPRNPCNTQIPSSTKSIQLYIPIKSKYQKIK